MKNDFTNLIKIIILGVVFSFGVGYLLAWHSPTATPPNGNISAPINASATPQAKGGPVTASLLDINGTLASQTLAVFGNMIVGNTAGGTVETTSLTGTTGNRPVCMNATGTGGTVVQCSSSSYTPYTLNVVTNGSGTVTSNPTGTIACGTTLCSNTVYGTIILSATPDAGKSFAGWSNAGDCFLNPSCGLTMTSNMTVTATFNPSQTPLFPSPANTVNPGGTIAVSVGNVASDNGFAVTARGVAWGLSANPTIAGSHTTDGSGVGSFVSTMTGLSQSTTYHVRAYATNSQGTGYGGDVQFTTLSSISIPTLDTPTATSIQTTSATLGAIVRSLGSPANITALGICYGTAANPTTPCQPGTLSQNVPYAYTVPISGLSAGTLYHYRGYAVNASGTGYTNDATFTTATPPCNGQFLYGRCWYGTASANQNCTTFCANNGHGACLPNPQTTRTQDIDLCMKLWGINAGGDSGGYSDSITPRRSGGSCMLQGYAGDNTLYTKTTCSNAYMYWTNACTCAQ